MNNQKLNNLSSLGSVIIHARTIINSAGLSQLSKTQINESRKKLLQLETVFVTKLLSLSTDISAEQVKANITENLKERAKNVPQTPLNTSMVHDGVGVVVMPEKGKGETMSMSVEVNKLEDPVLEKLGKEVEVAAPMKVKKEKATSKKEGKVRRVDAEEV